jgi:hypothetical protein
MSWPDGVAGAGAGPGLSAPATVAPELDTELLTMLNFPP